MMYVPLDLAVWKYTRFTTKSQPMHTICQSGRPEEQSDQKNLNVLQILKPEESFQSGTLFIFAWLNIFKYLMK